MSNKVLKTREKHTSEHYVPQVYMRQWSVKQSILQSDYISSNPVVYGMDALRQIKPYEIQFINCIDNLYEVHAKPDDVYRNLEDAFGEHESNLGSELPRIKSRGFKLDEEGNLKRKDHNLLCTMVAVMLIRNPIMFPMVKEAIGGLHFERTGDSTFKELFYDAGKKKHYTTEDTKLMLEYVLNMLSAHPKSDVVIRIRERLKDLKCYILESNREFLFSNTPVYFNIGLTEFYMPISPKYAVYFTDEDYKGLKAKQVNKVNANIWNKKLLNTLGITMIYASNKDSLVYFGDDL